MSFLLGGRKKRRGMAPPPQGGNRPSFRFDTSGNRGGGGRQGMVMLQRKPTTTQIHEATDLQQKNVQPVTPQQHSQGVISMKEVLEDLKELEKQQRDSHQKLQKARETKSRIEFKYKSVEQRLGDLKYSNGQTRVELKRIHEILSVGQRKMLAVRRGADNAHSNIRDFNDKLQRVVATKKFLVSYLQKQGSILSRLEGKASELQLLQNNADSYIYELKKDINRTKDQVQLLYRKVQDDTHRRVSLSSQATHLRSCISRLELDHHSRAKDLVAIKKRRDEVIIDENQMLGVLYELESKIATAKDSKASVELKQTLDLLDETHKSMEQALARHEDVRTKYSLNVMNVRALLSFDMSHFQDLLDKELEATGAEEESKLALISEMAKHRSEIISLLKQASTTEHEKQRFVYQVQEDQKIQLSLSRKESLQEQALAKVAARLHELRAAHKVRMTETKTKNAWMTERNLVIQEEVFRMEQRLEFAGRRRAEKQDNIDASKRAQREVLSEANGTIEKSQKAMLALEKEMKSLARLDCAEASVLSDQDYAQLAEDIIADNPTLETIEVVYDSKMTAKEQLRRNFSSLLYECKERVESAKKMRRDLDEAARQESQERNELQLLKEKERRRKDETRRRRESRMEAQKTVDSSKTSLHSTDKSRTKESRRSNNIERSGRSRSKDYIEIRRDKRSDRKGETHHKDIANGLERARSEKRKGEFNDNGDCRKEKSADPKNKRDDRIGKHSSSSRRKTEETTEHDRAGRSKSKEWKENGLRTESSRQEKPKIKTNKDTTVEKAERFGQEFGPSNDKKERSDRNSRVKSSILSVKTTKQDEEFHTEQKLGRDLATITETEKELDCVAVSAAKPRNLLSTFSQSSDTPGDCKAVPSSQKKVTWEEDRNGPTSRKRSGEGRDKKTKKTFRGGSISHPKSTISTALLSESIDAPTKKRIKPKHEARSKEKRTFGENKSRRHFVAKKPSHASSGRTESSSTTDSRLSRDCTEKKSFRSSSSANPEKQSKTQAPVSDGERSRSKQSVGSKTDKTALKRSQQSSGISSGEQRAHKRRRNGATSGNAKAVSSKSVGAQSFGTDVAFSF